MSHLHYGILMLVSSSYSNKNFSRKKHNASSLSQLIMIIIIFHSSLKIMSLYSQFVYICSILGLFSFEFYVPLDQYIALLKATGLIHMKGPSMSFATIYTTIQQKRNLLDNATLSIHICHS